MDIVEDLKLVGSVVGLISGGFLIYDRFVRDRPLAYMAKADAHYVDVVVKNVAGETLIVDQIAVAPNALDLAAGDELRDTISTIVRSYEDVPKSKRPCFFPIEPFGELKLRVITFDAFNRLRSNDRITIRLKWRNTRFTFPFARKVTVKTTAGDIRKLKDEVEREQS